MRRVVITGLGMVSPLACGVEETWTRLLAGQSGAGKITRFDASHLACDIACEVPLGDGWRCVGAPIFRLGVVQTDAFGDVVLPLDWANPPFNAGLGALHPGDTGHFQLWYRDPGFGPAGTNLTDGLGVPLCD